MPGNDLAMDYFALLLPILLIAGMFAGLVILKRRLFDDQPTQAPIPIPDIQPRGNVGRHDAPPPKTAPAPVSISAAPAGESSPSPAGAPAGDDGAGDAGVSLSPARPYPVPLLQPAHKTIFSRLLKALPGYVVLPGIAYDQFLEARDGSPSENTSLQNRARQQRADFVICDKKLNVLLVCQVEDGTHLPARILEREKMLQRAGLRLLRWNIEQPPDAARLLSTVQTLEKLTNGALKASG